MLNIFIGGFLLSIIHASIPNHWIPIVAISRTEKWSNIETLFITTLAGSAHTASTILIGIIIGLMGYKLNELFISVGSIYAPVVLILFGLFYIILNLKDLKKNPPHHHHKHIEASEIKSKRKKTAIILSLSSAMFFSPCAEIEAYFFTAGTIGWVGIFSLSITYFVVTVIGMVILVYLGLKGIGMLEKRFHFLEHHEKLITGTILILLGFISFFIKY